MDKDNRPGWAFAELTNAVIAHHAGAIDQAVQRAIEAGVSPDQIRLDGYVPERRVFADGKHVATVRLEFEGGGSQW